MRDFLGDLRYAIRMLAGHPGSALVVIGTLALAIGANSLVFSFANVLLIRPLPVEDPETLAMVMGVDGPRGNDRANVSLPDFLDWREHTTTLDDLAASAGASYTLTGRGEATRLSGKRVTASLFQAWGVKPILGRALTPADTRPGASPVVLLKHGYWTREFGGDPGVVGTTLVLDGIPHVVVGVLGPEFELGNQSLDDIWTPLVLEPTSPRDRRNLSVFGRLEPGVSVERASREFAQLAARLAREYPTTNAGWSARVITFYEGMTGPNSWLVLALLGVMVVLVLLVACANVANLLLARATTRARELAVRLSLGASRLRIGRQLLVEGLALGLIGGVVGLVLTWAGLAVIASVDAEPIFRQLVIDRHVLIFVTFLSLLAPVVFSLGPLMYAARTDLRASLNEAGRSVSAGRSTHRARAALVVCQLALALTVLVVSGLILRSAIAVDQVDLGFRPDSLLVGRVELDTARYTTPERRWRFVEQLLSRLAGDPRIAQRAAVDRLPALDGGDTSEFVIDGRAAPLPTDVPWATRFSVSPDYAVAMAIPLLSGRFFTPRDRRDTRPVVVVNQEMVRRYWPGASPIGDRIMITDPAEPPQWTEVVGIVGDVAPGLRGAATTPQLYVPLSQHSSGAMAFVLRAKGPDPGSLSGSLRGAIRALDPALALYAVEPLRATLDRARAGSRIGTGLFAAFGLVALLLATTGLFGVMSYVVSQRVPEIGIRMALGARASGIRLMVLRQAGGLVVTGAALGLAGGLGVATLMRGALYEVSPIDPVTLSGTAALLGLLAFVASDLPARRAARVDPRVAMRAE